jgi:FtsH-binding integral membrane protein
MYGGLLLFSAFLLYDTQRVMKRAEATPYYGHADSLTRQFDPINA